MNTYFISDLHVGHKSILMYGPRPFENMEKMLDHMKNEWNSVVKNKNDKVFVLGDVSFASKDFTKDYIQNLRGQKYLILGNHDRSHSPKWWIDVGFKEVYKFPIIYKNYYILSHEPVFMNDNMPYVNVHGHLHSLSMEGAKYCSVCVEKTNYRPKSFEEIKNEFSPR